MTNAAFAAFRDAVHGDAGLQHALGAERDRERFVALAVRLARERGIALSPEDVEAALHEGMRAWLERWIA